MFFSKRLGLLLGLAVLSAGLALFASAAADEPASAGKAVLVVRVPASAKLTIGSSSTSQRGAERTFLSPALPSGKDFNYTVKAVWTENGKERVVVREATVRAGQRTVVDVTKPESESSSGAVATADEKKPDAPKTASTKTLPLPAGQDKSADAAAEPKSRSFLFTYSATVTGLPADKTARIWLPVPSSSEDQQVEIVAKDLPAEGKIGRESKFGNQILYVEAKAGKDGTIPVKATYRVTRREVKGQQQKEKDADQIALFLQPDAKVPIDGKPLDLIKDRRLPMDQLAAARVLYDVVNSHMRYSKEGTGWGQGDSIWACQSGYGNCSDFHSLFISLARSQKIPAKFEIGFPLPPQHGSGEIPGYHCWAKFQPEDRGWVPVDISEANKNPQLTEYYFGNLSEDRVTFSTGRDLDLVPKQAGKPLNFFVYPYVEVDDKPYPAEKVERKFTYQDVPAKEST
jgi:uncharacterized protein (TIGR03000 family)